MQDFSPPQRLYREHQLLQRYQRGQQQRYLSLPFCAELLVRILGQYEHCRREYLEIKYHKVVWRLPALPQSFNGFRLLQLSDLHLGLHQGFVPRLSRLLNGIQADHCVITGDFVDHPGHPADQTLQSLREIRQALHMPVSACPGNHDISATLEVVPEADINLLCNQTSQLKSGSEGIYLCGIDDAHYFKTHDWEAIQTSGFRILLSHSPEVYRELDRNRIQLCLSGHTHGGQIRLPFLGALIKRCKVPRQMVWGRWQKGNGHGYTSSGTGASGVALRWNCPPEVVIHELQSAE